MSKYPNTTPKALEALREEEIPEAEIARRDQMQFTVLMKGSKWSESERDIVSQTLGLNVHFSDTESPIIVGGHFSQIDLDRLIATINNSFVATQVTGLHSGKLPFEPPIERLEYQQVAA